jgi:hypothetical protein
MRFLPTLTAAPQFLHEPPAPIAGEFLVNALNLLSQLLVVGFTLSPPLVIGLVVIAAGGQTPLLGRLSKLIPVLGGDYGCIGVFLC